MISCLDEAKCVKTSSFPEALDRPLRVHSDSEYDFIRFMRRAQSCTQHVYLVTSSWKGGGPLYAQREAQWKLLTKACCGERETRVSFVGQSMCWVTILNMLRKPVQSRLVREGMIAAWYVEMLCMAFLAVCIAIVFINCTA